MDINKLLRGVSCDCGRCHTCDIDYVYIEKGAIARLKKICQCYENVLIVADENTYLAAGDQTANALRDKNVRTLIFSGAEILVPNEAAIAEVTKYLENTDLIVGVGSGVIQDLCKYVSYENHLPYIIVATAPSMDGYASSGAAMITGGMKVTYPAGLPRAILADTQVLANAPISMIQAGYGDIIGKFSSLNDWKLSALVHSEYFCQYIYDVTYGQIQATLNLADGILKRDENSIKALMEALVVIGIMMSFAGFSRPASGSEHHLSHFFEITGILGGSAYFPHGLDVAYSTVITAKMREKLTQTQFPAAVYRPEKQTYIQKIESIYGSSAKSCMALQEKTGYYQNDNSRVYATREREIKQILCEMPSAEEMEKMLALVGLNMDAFYKMYCAEQITNAIFYAKDLKDRYTVLWLYYDMFGRESEKKAAE